MLDINCVQDPQYSLGSNEFREKCAILYHDLARAIEVGGNASRYRIPDLAEYRRLSGASPAQRRVRVDTFFNPPIRARSRLGQGLHDRGEASVFAEHELNAEDLAALAIH